MPVPPQVKEAMNGYHVFYKTLIVVATLVGVYLLYRLAETLVVLLGAIIFASAIRPLVDALVRRGMSRGLAILLVYVGILSTITGLLIVAIPPIINLTVQLFSGQILVEKVRELSRWLWFFGWDRFQVSIPAIFTLPEEFQKLLVVANDAVPQLAWPFARSVGYTVAQLVLALLMAFYWLTSRELILNLLLRMSPIRYRTRVEVIWTDIEESLGAYVRGQGILVLIVGASAYLGLLLLGIPYPLALGVIAGLTEAIPAVGPFLGAIPAVLVALTVSPLHALLVAGLYLIIQQVENTVLVPKVMERSVGLNPLIVILALIAGGVLNGAIGALLAIPVAGALKVIAGHLLIEPAIQHNAPRTEAGVVVFDMETPDEEEEVIVVPTRLESKSSS